MKKIVIGIDVGGSTTKIVGFRRSSSAKSQLINPLFVRATDPMTSLYGAFGRFTAENGLDLGDIERVMVTGVGSTVVEQNKIYGLDCYSVPEFQCNGLGGLYISGLSEAIVASLGTGTALIHAKEGQAAEYLGGTGVGGGTLVGLSKKLLGMDNISHIEELAEGGDLSKVDLTIGDLSRKDIIHGKPVTMTASNFGKLSDLATRSDIALGIINMVFETVGMMSIFAARSHEIRDIVLIGNLTSMHQAPEQFGKLAEMFGVRFIIPELAQFGTVIGAALHECP